MSSRAIRRRSSSGIVRGARLESLERNSARRSVVTCARLASAFSTSACWRSHWEHDAIKKLSCRNPGSSGAPQFAKIVSRIEDRCRQPTYAGGRLFEQAWRPGFTLCRKIFLANASVSILVNRRHSQWRITTLHSIIYDTTDVWENWQDVPGVCFPMASKPSVCRVQPRCRLIRVSYLIYSFRKDSLPWPL